MGFCTSPPSSLYACRVPWRANTAYNLQAFFLNLFAALLDNHVMRKVVWISGDVSPGSSNDKIMLAIMGKQWREIVGEGVRAAPAPLG